MGFVFISSKERGNIMRNIKRNRRRLQNIERRIDTCDTERFQNKAAIQKHDASMIGLTDAVKQLTEEFREYRRELKEDMPTIKRSKDNFTTWDTIKSGAQGFSAIIGAGVLLASTLYSVFVIIMKISSGD